MEVEFHSFLAASLDGSEKSASCPDRFVTRNRFWYPILVPNDYVADLFPEFV
jgi:hypothetical protein